MSGIVPWTGNAYVPTFPAPTNFPVSPFPSQSLRDWWKELHGETIQPPPTRVQSAVIALRHNGESAAMGAILALVDTVLGGLDLGGRIPLDWAGAVLFYALSVRDNSPNGLSEDFRALGQSCTTIALYRMVHRKLENKKVIPQNTSSSDPILATGRSVSF